MKLQGLIVLSLAVSACGILAAAVGGQTPPNELEKFKQMWLDAKANRDLQIKIESHSPAAKAFVGDEVTFDTSLLNTSQKTLLICDWQNADRFPGYWYPTIEVDAFPGEKPSEMHGSPFGMHVTRWTPRKEDFRPLPAGQSTSALKHKVRLMLPGKLRFTTAFQMYNFYFERETTLVTVPDAWSGLRLGEATLKVSDQMSDAMAQRYARHAQTVRDGKLSLEDRLSALQKVADEENYFAARFLRDVWKQVDEPEVNQAALRHLVHLFAFHGTAYEAMPELLKVMEDPQTTRSLRERIILTLSQFQIATKYPKVRIAGQAWYFLPAGDVTAARASLQALANGPDPSLAELAKKALAGNASLIAGRADQTLSTAIIESPPTTQPKSKPSPNSTWHSPPSTSTTATSN